MYEWRCQTENLIELTPERWYFDGSFAPETGAKTSAKTFSVGIFPLQRDSTKGKVVMRVEGPVKFYRRVYEQANIICDGLNTGALSPKHLPTKTTVCTR